MTVLRALLVCLVALVLSSGATPSIADDLKTMINALADGSLKDRAEKSMPFWKPETQKWFPCWPSWRTATFMFVNRTKRSS